jgi:hypothetical protein
MKIRNSSNPKLFKPETLKTLQPSGASSAKLNLSPLIKNYLLLFIVNRKVAKFLQHLFVQQHSFFLLL